MLPVLGLEELSKIIISKYLLVSCLALNTKKSNINNTKQFKTKSFSTKPFETRYKSPAKTTKRKYSEGDNFFELESKYEKSWLDKEREAENKRIARQKSTGEF